MMSKKFYLLLLAAFALAACDPKREISPEEQREIERQDRQVWRQMSGDFGRVAPDLQLAQYPSRLPTGQTGVAEISVEDRQRW